MALFDNFEMITLANLPAGPKQGDWTYDDYCRIPEDSNRYEIIAAVLCMAPSPEAIHQESAGLIYHYLMIYIHMPGLGIVIDAPFDVELEKKTIVQPDVSVLLPENAHKYVPLCIIGAPDLVVEVAFPSTRFYDRSKKISGIRARRCERVLAGRAETAKCRGAFLERRTLPEPGHISGTGKTADPLDRKLSYAGRTVFW